jgi:hypothetical protein
MLFGSGKWEDTWLGKAFSTLKGWGSKALGFLGFGGNQASGTQSPADAMNGIQNLNSVPGMSQASPMGPAGGPGGMSYTTVQSPQIKVEVNGAHDPKSVAAHTVEKISTWWEAEKRRTGEALKPVTSY